MKASPPNPPVILLGGGANALSVARNLSRLGTTVYALNEPTAFVRHSRHCKWIDVPARGNEDRPRAWLEFLLGAESDFLRGAVVLACGDDGIQLLASHRERLAFKYVLDDSNPDAQMKMLNKLATYEAAVAAGVPTPKFWVIDSPDQIGVLREALVYPLIVKPRLSHIFEGRSGKKLIVANDFEETTSAVQGMLAAGAECLLMEMIPGPDDRLCSYYTYLDADSRPLFHFTKRIIRRYPLLRGMACYHVTDWIPEAGEIANRLFKHVGLRGIANVEFKLDERDGQLKLIECNARFTASDCLVARSGCNLAAFVYCRLTGKPLPPMKLSPTAKYLWDPIRDFQAFLALRQLGQLTFTGWVKSVLHRQSFAYFSWSDPMPALARLTMPLRKLLTRIRRTRVEPSAPAAPAAEVTA